MKTMQTALVRLMNEEDGQNLIEYGLIAGIIAVGAIVAMTSLRTKITATFNYIGSQLANAT